MGSQKAPCLYGAVMKGIVNPRIVLAGAIFSTERTLRALLRHEMNLVGVLNQRPADPRKVSGYTDLERLSHEANVPFLSFKNINDPEVVAFVKSARPDVLFVVGISQLVKEELMSLPTLGTVGFHPTRLPKGRGRAPVAWVTLDGSEAAANFFLINEGVDAGPIFASSAFQVGEEDDAGDVAEKLLVAIDLALDGWLPRLKAGKWDPTPQDDDQATYHGKRDPVDGLIDWHDAAEMIAALVRASTRPHPGAYTFHRGEPLRIWKARVERDCRYRGVIGRVLEIFPDGTYFVQTGPGVLRVLEQELAEGARPPRVGEMLGFVPQQEIYALRNRVAQLEELVKGLLAQQETSK
jgi:methionyl-tRNA formyltransferase